LPIERFLPGLLALQWPLRKFGACVCLLSLTAVPGVVVSQEDFGQLAEHQRQLAAEIDRIEAQSGPQARELIEPLTALSLSFEEAGDFDLADATIERLLQVMRANYGLYSLEQVPSILLLRSHELARGNAAAAWELEQETLRLGEKNPEDIRTARILRDAADRRMDLLERYNAGEFSPEILLGCYYRQRIPHVIRGGPNDNCTSGSRRIVRQNLLTEAQNLYSQAINILLLNEGGSGDELPTLLMDLADSSYRYNNPSLGRRSLRYLLAYQTASSAPLLDRVDTLVQIADWDLLYSESSSDSESALAGYEEALRLLDDAPASRAWIEQIFSPEIPIRLPAFYPNPLVTTRQESVGYLDVAFVVDARGRSGRVRILDSTRNAPEFAEKQLKELIERSRFRPQLVDGKFTDTDTIVVRYHLHE
jgi:hypothetical protein